MKRLLIKALLVSLITAIYPINTVFAENDAPAPVLTGSVTTDNAIELSWTTPDKKEYPSVYKNYKGYAIFNNYQPYALLEFEDHAYSSYYMVNPEEGKNLFQVKLFYYNIYGMHYENPSNYVQLTVKKEPSPFNLIKIAPITPPETVKMSIAKSDGKITVNWTPYSGTFNGYIVKVAQVNKKGKPIGRKTTHYPVPKNENSFELTNVIAGHKYLIQVLTYTNNSEGKMVYLETGKSSKKIVKIDEEFGKIVLTATAADGKIEASFTSPSSKKFDGYAIYMIKGKQFEANLVSATSVFLAKDKTTFTAYPSETGYYTLKVYAYNERPDGTKVYHQPGSNWVTVENAIP